MNTKLTLTVDQKAIESAKAFARENGRSLSDLVENYFKSLTQDHKSMDNNTPIVNSMRGAFRAPDGFNYKEELKKKLSEKYL